jgi:hypothetical protein
MNDQNPEEVKAEVVGVPEDKASGLAITALVSCQLLNCG